MKIEKTVVNSKTRSLSANYTFDVTQELEHIMGDELQKAINDEILNTIDGPNLVEQGWTQYTIGSYEQIPQQWLDDNMTDDYKCYGYYWYFKSKKDATLFALRWSE